ncbi:ATP-dependent DNA helicase RecG [filamentous cyanobacterium CCP5]|nr:ATP-dependent DNA helicase RecG [filamentous cyanobacterium CCP5]
MAAINRIIISDTEVQKILVLEESHFCDIKSIDISPAKLTKAISAFANAEGGELFIGIEDTPRVWRGFQAQEAANGHIQALEGLFPLGTDFQYEFLSNPNEAGILLRLQVAKTRDIKPASDTKVYLRRGAQSLPITDPERIERLKRDKGLTSFESEPINCPRDLVTNSENILAFLIEVVPTAEPEVWLRKQLLLLDNKPTVAAALLFAEEPQAIIPKRCGIKIYQYKTSQDDGTRESLEFNPISIEGCIYNQIRDAVNEASKIVESVRVRTPEGLTSAKYPPEAIHEIVTNAVIHRDYSIADDIHIRIFDNRVEVLSPGTLPGHVTVTNILEERFARNPALIRIINKFPDPPNKDVGEGLNTAFLSMREMKLKEPVIDQTGGYVKVILRHEPLATPEEAILSYLLEHSEIANRDAREICYVKSENRMKRILQNLVKKDLLESVPGRTRYNAAYQLTEAGREEARRMQ